MRFRHCPVTYHYGMTWLSISCWQAAIGLTVEEPEKMPDAVSAQENRRCLRIARHLRDIGGWINNYAIAEAAEAARALTITKRRGQSAAPDET